jgi:hypothetical protein
MLRAPVSFAQQMQPGRLIYVDSGVEKLVLIDGALTRELPRRFESVARPALHAGVGNALRQAYDMNGTARDLTPFEDLLTRLG